MGLLFKTFLLGGLLLWGIQSRAVEVLGHINEDSQSPPQSQTPPANNDRSITYRVICTPGGEVLPDCEQPVSDQEDSPTPVIATPDMPPGAEDLVEEAGNEKQLAVEPAVVTSPRTSAKPVKQKANSKNKTSAKKTETLRKPAKSTTSKKASKQKASSKSTSKKTKNK